MRIVAAALLLANCIVSFYVIRSSFYSALQKAAQCLIVWVLPLLGPIFVWNFLRTQESRGAKNGNQSSTGGYDNTIVVTDGSHDGFSGSGHGGPMH
jgi:hypothetical protein